MTKRVRTDLMSCGKFHNLFPTEHLCIVLFAGAYVKCSRCSVAFQKLRNTQVELVAVVPGSREQHGVRVYVGRSLPFQQFVSELSVLSPMRGRRHDRWRALPESVASLSQPLRAASGRP